MMNIIHWVIQKLRTDHQIQRARFQSIMQNNNPTFYFIASFDPMGSTLKKNIHHDQSLTNIGTPTELF